jgi:hypothetical protein
MGSLSIEQIADLRRLCAACRPMDRIAPASAANETGIPRLTVVKPPLGGVYSEGVPPLARQASRLRIAIAGQIAAETRFPPECGLPVLA